MDMSQDKTVMYISIAAVFMAILGSATGFFFYSSLSNSSQAKVLSESVSQNVDEELFVNGADAQGKLVEGGVDGEGTHKLERPEGEPVYLLSTVLDLDSFIGKEVQIWGNTISSTKADWLMDVGRVKIIK